jgi:uncharacterized protein YceH (UPF0502 family)
MEPAPPAAATPESWPVLDLHERRVLGVLIEKAKTTPDAYPLSLNALVTGCNQKSNRDPVLNLSDADVELALAGLQKKTLVLRLTGSGRVERWRHIAYETWRVDKVELAVLAELLLRGAQTEGELRGRASRMEPIEDLDKLRAVLKNLTERGLVIYLTPQGRRGTVLTHGFCNPQDLERLKAMHGGSGGEWSPDEGAAAPRAAVSASVLEPHGSLEQVHQELATLKTNVTELQTKVAELTQELQGLKASLGL